MPKNKTITDSQFSTSTLLASLGPGILMAAAAIGASHLVSSTRAGAEFGWQLAWVVLLVNLLKYPFFAAGARYTAATNESLLHGYLKQGRGYLLMFTCLNTIAAIASTAGVCMLTAAMLTQFIPLPIDILAFLVLISSLALLILGHYQLLDKLTKVIMLALTLTTLVAVALAWQHYQGPIVTEQKVSPWQWAYVGFLVAMMGWMPAPIEVSAWNSLWLLEKKKTQTISSKQAIFDFNLGFVVTAILAIIFLALGALVMHGSGEVFSSSGAKFASQLVDLYSDVMGEETRYLIGLVAFLCIFSTTVTVIDGYSRTLDIGWQLLNNKQDCTKRLTRVMLLVSSLGLVLIWFFKGALLPLLEFVMTLAFLTTVIFAWLNLRLMTSETLPEQHRYGTKMKILAGLGLVYLFGFSCLFIYWKLAIQSS
ncbi:divalent metal cation transporter [Shewanella sp. MMG014]|uniref:NRAMP family divalent metal transporter n=1 Tax=Shewanella sp. MMG014 TaxID=2822691 RepID=UPI001B3594CA|nr:divalent metal cation transporter [Shewanella sp. MMG014]MBQ4889752.1 divalent metal cation transporter [Shewanella sp. MMG014]